MPGCDQGSPENPPAPSGWCQVVAKGNKTSIGIVWGGTYCLGRCQRLQALHAVQFQTDLPVVQVRTPGALHCLGICAAKSSQLWLAPMEEDTAVTLVYSR